MSLSQQVRNLIDAAPGDLQTAIAALVPALLESAAGLKCLQYFVGCGPTGQWLVTTLQNRQSGQEIKVIYCFATALDLQSFYPEPLGVMELPLLDLLFQLNVLAEIDQLVFYDTANFGQGRPVKRQDLQQSIERHLSSPPPMPC